MYTTQFSRKNHFDYQNLEKKCFFIVWQLSTLVPIKMLVPSLTELHTPQQTISFSIVSKEQPLFKSGTGRNPVFQPILTVTIVTVNMAWNTGFSLVTDLNKCCSLPSPAISNHFHLITAIPLREDIRKKRCSFGQCPKGEAQPESG